MLVAIEGIDGAGKSSIATLLAQWCGERGLGCMLSKEPTSLKWGQELRTSAKAGRLTLERELELFALDRRDHVGRAIAPALAEGNIVILDRYYWSTAAYQGARGADVAAIIREHETFAPAPDMYFVMNLDVDAGLQRIRMRGDRPNLFESKDALLRAKEIFIDLARDNPRAQVIDSGGYLKDAMNTALTTFCRVAMEKIMRAAPVAEDSGRIAGVFSVDAP